MLILSQRLSDDVVRTRFHDLDPNRFRATRFRVKGTSHAGYLCSGQARGAGAGSG